MEDDDTGSRLRPSRRPSQVNLRHHRRRLSVSSARGVDDERSSLLDAADLTATYATVPGTPRPRLSRQSSSTIPRAMTASFTQRLNKQLSIYEGKLGDIWADERVWYDQVCLTMTIIVCEQG